MNEEENVIFFETAEHFRIWLRENHGQIEEQWVGFHKKATGRRCITWPESVEQALCFGWIDGLRKSIDHESYKIRFTPRKPGSHWSNINIKKVKELKEKGLMEPAGLKAYKRRNAKNSRRASYEQRSVKLRSDFEEQLKANKKAWQFFNSQPPYYRKTSIHWVMSAKRDKTRVKRLETLIADSENGMKIKPMRR